MKIIFILGLVTILVTGCNPMPFSDWKCEEHQDISITSIEINRFGNGTKTTTIDNNKICTKLVRVWVIKNK